VYHKDYFTFEMDEQKRMYWLENMLLWN